MTDRDRGIALSAALIGACIGFAVAACAVSLTGNAPRVEFVPAFVIPIWFGFRSLNRYLNMK